LFKCPAVIYGAFTFLGQQPGSGNIPTPEEKWRVQVDDACDGEWGYRTGK